MEQVDGEPRPALWELAASDAAARALLPAGLAERLSKLPKDLPIGWSELLRRTGIPKSTASRLIDRAEAVGLLERNRVDKTFRRKA